MHWDMKGSHLSCNPLLVGPVACGMSPRQARRERAEMGLKARSQEILLGEMTVLTREQRLELVRLHKANKKLREHLAERSSQVWRPAALGTESCIAS